MGTGVYILISKGDATQQHTENTMTIFSSYLPTPTTPYRLNLVNPFDANFIMHRRQWAVVAAASWKNAQLTCTGGSERLTNVL